MSRSVLGTGVLLLAMVLLLFILTRAADGDPARSALGPYATEAEVAALREDMGLERPLLVQYVDYVGDALRGDLGNSYFSHQPVSELIGSQAPVTLLLLAGGVVVSLAISLVMAGLGAHWRRGPISGAVRAISIGALVAPSFWVGLLLIVVFSIHFDLLPSGGFDGDVVQKTNQLILPVVALGITIAPFQTRTLRTSLVEALNSDFIDSARARGVSEARVLLRHALPNAIAPTIALTAVMVSQFLFAAVVLENTFRLPGLGRGIVEAAVHRDYPMLLGASLFVAVCTVVITSLGELLRVAMDPRARTA